MLRPFFSIAWVLALCASAQAQTWREVNSSIALDAQIMSFVTNDTGIVADFPNGGPVDIHSSMDGGSSFTNAPYTSTAQTGSSPVPYISWPTSHDGYMTYMVGSAPALLRTTDAGKTWVASLPKELTSVKVDGISFPSVETGYVVGQKGNGDYYIFRTTNSGATWKAVYQNNLVVSRISFHTPAEGIFYVFTASAAPQVAYTLDSLSTAPHIAKQLGSSASTLPYFIYWNRDNSWIANYAGIQRSTDYGQSWSVVLNSADRSSDYGDIITASFHGRRGFAFPEYGPICFATTDYGATWTSSSTGRDTLMHDNGEIISSMPSSTVAYVLGTKGSIDPNAAPPTHSVLLSITLPVDPGDPDTTGGTGGSGGTGSVAITPRVAPVAITEDGSAIAFGMEPSPELRTIEILDLLGRVRAEIRVEPMATSAEILRSKLQAGSYLARLRDSLVKFAIW